MPIYREPLQLGSRREDIHVLDFSTHFNDDRLSRRTLLSESACMTFGTKNIRCLPDEFKKRAFTNGQIYEGYYIRTINGPYDYCYKIWTKRQWPFPPLNSIEPNSEEFVDAIVIDENDGYFGLACGGNIAYCTKETIIKAGIKPADVILPMIGMRVKLRKLDLKRPPQIPYAAFEATNIVFEKSKEYAPKVKTLLPDIIEESAVLTHHKMNDNTSKTDNITNGHFPANYTNLQNKDVLKSFLENKNCPLSDNNYNTSIETVSKHSLDGSMKSFSKSDVNYCINPDITNLLDSISRSTIPLAIPQSALTPEDVAISVDPLNSLIAKNKRFSNGLVNDIPKLDMDVNCDNQSAECYVSQKSDVNIIKSLIDSEVIQSDERSAHKPDAISENNFHNPVMELNIVQLNVANPTVLVTDVSNIVSDTLSTEESAQESAESVSNYKNLWNNSLHDKSFPESTLLEDNLTISQNMIDRTNLINIDPPQFNEKILFSDDAYNKEGKNTSYVVCKEDESSLNRDEGILKNLNKVAENIIGEVLQASTIDEQNENYTNNNDSKIKYNPINLHEHVAPVSSVKDEKSTSLESSNAQVVRINDKSIEQSTEQTIVQISIQVTPPKSNADSEDLSFQIMSPEHSSDIHTCENDVSE